MTDSRQQAGRALNPARLLVEILLIVALTQLAVSWLVELIAPGVVGPVRLVLGAALLVLLAGPAIYWRCISPSSAPADSVRSRVGRQPIRSAIAMTAAAQIIGLALTAGGLSRARGFSTCCRSTGAASATPTPGSAIANWSASCTRHW